MLDLKSMRYFVTVVEEGSITHAAERLGIQQPPLSTQMKTLEQRMGLKLLTRMPRGVLPTPAGNALYEASQKILADIDKAVAKVRSIDRAYSGQLHIGVTRSTISHPRVKEAISAFVEQYTHVDVSIVNKATVELCAALADDEIDLAIARPFKNCSERLRRENLVSEAMVAALPKSAQSSLLSPNTSISLKELAQLKAILYRDSTESILYNDIVQAFKEQELTLATIQEAPSALVALDLVSTGLGFTLVPLSLSDRYKDRIVYRALAHMATNEATASSSLTSSICLYTRHSETGDLSRAFRQLLLDSQP